MIHFRCGCGLTLSAEDVEAGRSLRCGGCGEAVPVPAAPVATAVPPTRRSRTGHDFDAEIVRASREAPPRPVKTPGSVPAAAEGAGAAETPLPAPPPRWDLLRVESAVRWSGPLAAVALVLGTAGGAAAFVLLPGGPLLRAGVGVALVATGGAAFAALVAVRELGRCVLGLAERQRELADEIGE